MSISPTKGRATNTALVTTCAELRRRLSTAARPRGLVPTMGALHAGHLSLVEASRRECDFTVATVFVNPTQFGHHDDFARYPRNLEADLAALEGQGVDVVFAPSVEELYPPGDSTLVEVGGVAASLEGVHRPGHFRGVATVVLKLCNLVQPDRAYFGRKDYQQLLVIRQTFADLKVPVEVRDCPTVREPDGLALSSRNAYLSPDERRRARSIYQSLRLAGDLVQKRVRDSATLEKRMRELLTASDLNIEYVALVDPQSLEPVTEVDRPTLAVVAACVGKTRLIDNELIG